MGIAAGMSPLEGRVHLILAFLYACLLFLHSLLPLLGNDYGNDFSEKCYLSLAIQCFHPACNQDVCTFYNHNVFCNNL